MRRDDGDARREGGDMGNGDVSRGPSRRPSIYRGGSTEVPAMIQGQIKSGHGQEMVDYSSPPPPQRESQSENEAGEITTPAESHPIVNIHRDPQRDMQSDMQRETQRERERQGELDARPHTDCWFCLLNPSCEKRLIVTVLKEVFMSSARGGLTSDHTLILPVRHYANLKVAPASVIAETDSLTRKISQYFAQKNGSRVIFFERFIPMKSARAMHTQIHAVPVPPNLLDQCIQQFMVSNICGVRACTQFMDACTQFMDARTHFTDMQAKAPAVGMPWRSPHRQCQSLTEVLKETSPPPDSYWWVHIPDTVSIHIHIHAYQYTHVCVCACTKVCVSACTQVCVSASTQVCVSACTQCGCFIADLVGGCK